MTIVHNWLRRLLTHWSSTSATARRIGEIEKIVPLEADIAATAMERRHILEELRNELKIDVPDIDVVISEETDALRFQKDGRFATL